jgi:DNA-directed RNA polymerase specialized sigma24 family protein
MPESDTPRVLIDISTQWSPVFQAHHGAGGAAHEAQQQLLLRYCGAVHRYLLKALRDPEAAAEQSQEFALRFVRGDFNRADPGRGRFRDFLRTVLYHLVVDYHRVRRAQPAPLPADSAHQPVAPEAVSLDREFLDQWRRELLAQSWEGLEADQQRGKRPYYTVLRWRARVRFAELLRDEVARSIEAATPQQVEEELRDLGLQAYCPPPASQKGRGMRDEG